MQPLPPKDPPVRDVADSKAALAKRAPAKRRQWLVPTVGIVGAVVVLAGFFPYMHFDGRRVVRVTGRLVAERTGEALMGARVLTMTPADLRIARWSGEMAWERWEGDEAAQAALARDGEEVGAWPWGSFHENAGARSSEDGSVTFRVGLPASLARSFFRDWEGTPDPEENVAALWVAPEGGEPVVVRLEEGRCQQNPEGEDYPVWGTHDLGTVVVPVGEDAD